MAISQTPVLPMTLHFEPDMDRLKEVPMDNQRCVRKYQEDENATPVPSSYNGKNTAATSTCIVWLLAWMLRRAISTP